MARFLVLGGLGFIGRNVVYQLVKSGKASEVIVADKSRPELSWLSADHKDTFADSLVVFKQCNLSISSAVENLFNSYEIDYVINCASESRLGLQPEIYKDSIVNVACVCANIAASKGVKKFIQISTGAVYSSKNGVATEDSEEDPCTLQSISHRDLDIELGKIAGLNYVIIRPATVYGFGDFYILTPRFVIASVYHLLKEKMKLLYNKDFVLNTVHVTDVALATIFLCDKGECGKKYILCDKSNTTLGSLNDILAKIFKLNYGFISSAENAMAKTMLKRVAKDLNEKHLTPWSKACVNEGIQSTPLSPYVDKEALKRGTIFLDGSYIESLGFNYNYPTLTEENIRLIIEDFVKHKMFPAEGYPEN